MSDVTGMPLHSPLNPVAEHANSPSASVIEEVEDEEASEYEAVIKEIVALERSCYFEKRASKAERQRKLREIIERYSPAEGDDNGA